MNQSEKLLDIGIDIEQCRQEHNLPQLTPKIRQCLRCGSHFNSEGNHNRICLYCKIDFRTIPTSICETVFMEYRSVTRRWMLYNKKRKALC